MKRLRNQARELGWRPVYDGVKRPKLSQLHSGELLRLHAGLQNRAVRVRIPPPGPLRKVRNDSKC